MTPTVLLISETINNRPVQPLEDLVRFAEELFPGSRAKIIIIMAGQDIQLQAKAAAEATGIDVIALEDHRLLLPNPELLSKGLYNIINEVDPLYICLTHTPRGCQTAAFLSHALQASCITNIESLKYKNNTPLFRRSIFNGKFVMDIKGHGGRTILTVVPGAFDNANEDRTPLKPGKVTVKNLPYESDESIGFIPLQLTSMDDSDNSLEEADVIVSVGMGVGKAENVDLARDVASLLKNAAVGASRIACDMGWLSHSKQIGETGKKVAPKLYMACGISGSAQHIAGIKNSQMIIAINKDPRAVIFSIADYGIVEDLTTFLPILIDKMQIG
ncbi:MAG: electron transfer flavoprotein subunit alpha/FixB family protein [Deltaproteobacteria bacterium]|nr:electron transfer flavoprotein subunit alpha/FixB family protein [Deltaproteobacteria bacterium]